MKLRCTQNSVRIRVRKSDIETLAQQGTVRESVCFGPTNFFHFELGITPGIDSVEATFSEGVLRVVLPKERAQSWMNSSEVGIEVQRTNAEGAISLHLLIEKDFPCLDRDNEDKSDTFWELAADNPEKC